MSPSQAGESEGEIVCLSSPGYHSSPGGLPSKKTSLAARKSRSLPSKMVAPPANHLISRFFKPVVKKSADSSESEVEVVEDFIKDAETSAKDTESSKDPSTQTTRAPSPMLSPIRKPTSPFKTIRMCTTTTKIIRPILKIEFSSDDTGTEGPLSDIDDILTGTLHNLESHPLAGIVFQETNPHLKKIMERISGGEQLEDPEEPEKEEEEPEKKKKEKKPRAERKKKTQERSYSGSESDKGRKKIMIRKLPLSQRQIYHGRNWVPMTTWGEGEEEAECECSWTMDYTGKKLDDIVDLNSAEKTMMNLWNKHVNKYQVVDACVFSFFSEAGGYG